MHLIREVRTKQIEKQRKDMRRWKQADVQGSSSSGSLLLNLVLV